MTLSSARAFSIAVLMFCCLSLASPHLRAQASACTAPEYRQFDFWVGDWDTYDADAPSKVVARNRVELILDRCVIHEIYDGFNGSHGESFSIYDSARHLWHQSWVTNRGQLLLLDGRMESGAMMLQGIDRSQKEGERLIRGIWKPVTDGVRETAEVSRDQGKTWQPLFDIIFRPHGK
jgi:hypothetical protein